MYDLEYYFQREKGVTTCMLVISGSELEKGSELGGWELEWSETCIIPYVALRTNDVTNFDPPA